jgi:hypothetical protein
MHETTNETPSTLELITARIVMACPLLFGLATLVHML